MQRILHEGYRWADFGGWDLYVQSGDGDGSQYNSLSPRALLCREWDWTFGSGQTVKRRFAIFNDTHDARPIYARWRLLVGSAIPYANAKAYTVAPGTSLKIDKEIAMPEVKQREEGTLELVLMVDNKEVFRDAKPVSILPASERAAPAATAASLAVFDPAGSAAAYLKSRGMAFMPVADLAQLPDGAKTLLIGANSLNVTESTSSRLAAYAAGGRAVIVLEQKNPLKYQALPAQIDTADSLPDTFGPTWF